MLSFCIDSGVFVKQAELLEQCIAEHKWYLSEQAGYDVGWDAAELSFIKIYWDGFTAGFRATYCGLVCEHREYCSIANKHKDRKRADEP